MKNEKLQSILKNIGLSETEAEVYLASLSLGPTTILKIARSSGVKRTSVYTIIDALKEKGLMKIELKGLKQLYAAESPEKLAALLEARERDFKSQLPEFLALYKLQGSESVMKYYTGIKAMQDIYMESLKDIRPHEEYLVITNQKKWYELDPNFALRYIEARAKLNITIRLLFQDSDVAQEHKRLERNFNEQVKILPNGAPLNVDTLLLPTKLVVVELTPPYTTLVIENRSVVELHKEMFEIIWRSIQ